MLPASRNTNYVSGVTPVKANDIDDLQDQVVAINNLVTGQPQANWTNVVLAGNLTVGGQAFSFNDFTFTADSTTDQLAATGNPLQTGDGPLRPSNSGGSLPGGLSAGTDFYWIRIDADHGKAATSRANAIAGIAIDIASNGSGTQTVVHQVGTTRVSDAEVTRNLTVDGNINVNGRITNPRTLHFNAAPGIPQSNSSTWVSDAGGVTGTPLPQWAVPLHVPIGATIVAVRARVKDASGTVLTFITTKSVDATETGIGGAGSASAGSGAWQTLSRTLNEPTVAGTNYYATVFTSSGSGAGHFAWIEVDIA